MIPKKNAVPLRDSPESSEALFSLGILHFGSRYSPKSPKIHELHTRGNELRGIPGDLESDVAVNFPA